MNLLQCREPIGIGQGEIKEDGIVAIACKMSKRFAESRDVGDVELFNAPFSQDVPSEVGIDIIVFDQQQFDYRRTQT